ncbi:hypothetical protein M408DRAFT_9622 [Serendipita vermifera MAFF 305830]|uniref:DUF6697 domain-containing protein n=1 Tax=Serendipita vermifera MAFF 305830 TaxID=933852 RepID=A0A0C2WK84_SERVB|nr:hypothetical protein M408DRAFT_9622 [Serendipita vermifera MAFF 305830]
MTDTDVAVLNQEALLSLWLFFCDFESHQTPFIEIDLKDRFESITGELVGRVRDQPLSSTVGLKFPSEECFTGISAILGTSTVDFHPVVSIAIGQAHGSIHDAIESIYDNKDGSLSHLAIKEKLVHGILRLWQEILATWIPPILRAHSSDIESERIISVSLLIKEETDVVIKEEITVKVEPMIKEESIEPTVNEEAGIKEEPVDQEIEALKRAYSSDEESLHDRPLKRLKKIASSPPLQVEPSHLSREWVRSMLQDLASIPPPKGLVNIMYTFRRERFSRIFGGGSQGLETGWPRQPKYPKRPADAESEWLIGAQTDFNPYLPTYPCTPGLIFRAPGLTEEHGNTAPNPSTRTVSVKIDTGKWLYMGEYVIKHRGNVPLAEWKALSDKTRRGWVEYSVGHYMVDGEKGPKTNSDEMRRCLDNGSLRLEVYEMQCVGYVVSLQAKIIELGLSERVPSL